MTIVKALLLFVLLSGGAFGIFAGHREVGGSDEDLEDIEPRGESDGGGGSGEERSGHHHHHREAHSFQHFHGPVSGHHQEVTCEGKHGHHHHDDHGNHC